MKVKYFFVIVAALWLVLGIKMLVGNAQPCEKAGEVPSVTDPGFSTVKVDISESQSFFADEFAVTVSLHMQGADAAKLSSDMEERRAGIFDLAKSQGIAKKNIEQNNMDLHKTWRYDEGRRTPSGFEASQIFTIRVPSKKVEMALTDALALQSDVEVLGASGCIKDSDSLHMNVLKSAGKKAMEKASLYADAANMKIGSVVSANVSSSDNYWMASDSVSVSASVSLSVEALPKGKKSVSPKAYVVVPETISRKYAADEFRTTLSLQMMGHDKEELYRNMTQRRNRVMELIGSLDIPQSDVEEKSVSLRKEWVYENHKHIMNGYSASQNIVVTTKSRSLAAVLVNTLSVESDVEVQMTAATLSKADSLQANLVKLVCEKAMGKARAASEGLGGKVGDVLEIQDQSSGAVLYDAMPLTNAPRMRAMAKGASLASESVIADSVELSAGVSLKMELLR